MDNQKSSTNIILTIVGVVLLGVIIYFMFIKKSEPVVQESAPVTNQTEAVVPLTPVETVPTSETTPVTSLPPKLPDAGNAPK